MTQAATMLLPLILAALSLGVQGNYIPPSTCKPFHRGSFNIKQYQLYPENADWDEKSCLVYFG